MEEKAEGFEVLRTSCRSVFLELWLGSPTSYAPGDSGVYLSHKRETEMGRREGRVGYSLALVL